jgi:E3 ubiquitin-protein ligase RAD18
MFGIESNVDGVWQWPDNPAGKRMADLEGALRCDMCTEFYVNPHSLKCGHCYCSECIRRHLDQT